MTIFFSKTPILLGPLYEILLKSQFSLFTAPFHHLIKESAMCDHKLNKCQGKECESTHGTQKSSLGHKHGIHCKGYTGIPHLAENSLP